MTLNIESTAGVTAAFRRIAGLLAPITLSLLVLGCSGDPESTPSKDLGDRSFVLVHGSWNGPWVWTDVAAQLEARGAAVSTVNLAAHGDDTTPLTEASLAKYVSEVRAAVEAAKPPVVLVGHSFGGIVISQVAEGQPKNLDRLIYLGAFLPQNGESALDLAQTDADSKLGPVLQIDPDKGVAAVAKADFPGVFCGDCGASQLDLLGKKYRDEPLAPLAEKVTLTDAGFGSTPKFYIHTGRDQVISLGLQKRMASHATLVRTATIETSHSPFLSAPADVVTALASLGKD